MFGGWAIKIAYWMWLALIPIAALSVIGAVLGFQLPVEIAFAWLLTTGIATMVSTIEWD